MSNNGQIIVISGPSGSGKTTLARMIIEKQPNIVRSISATTRSPRRGERDGVDYFFVSVDDFKKGIAVGDFAEWAIYDGNYYGTPKREIEETISAGKDILLTIEVQGAKQIRSIFPDALLIFVLPPSMDALRERISRRRSNSPQEIENRLQIAIDEIAQIGEYDFFVVNEEGEQGKAVETVLSIITAGRQRLTPNKVETIKRRWQKER